MSHIHVHDIFLFVISLFYEYCVTTHVISQTCMKLHLQIKAFYDVHCESNFHTSRYMKRESCTIYVEMIHSLKSAFHPSFALSLRQYDIIQRVDVMESNMGNRG